MPDGARDRRFEAVAQWLATHAAGPFVVLCRESPAGVAAGRPAVRLDACLADTPPYRLLDLALAAGQPALVATAGCTGSPPVAALESLSRLVGEGRLALDRPAAWASASATGPVVEVDRPPLPRRGLLAGRRPDPPVRHDADDDAGRLVESLRRAGVTDAAASAPGIALTATTCSACGLCVRTCPHQALELVHDGGTSRLLHVRDRCRGERVCVAVCPVQGLTGGDALTWQDALAGPRRLLEVSSQPCGRCRARTTRPDGLCDACAFRRDHPFGSYVVPAMRHRVDDGR